MIGGSIFSGNGGAIFDGNQQQMSITTTGAVTAPTGRLRSMMRTTPGTTGSTVTTSAYTAITTLSQWPCLAAVSRTIRLI